MGSSTLGGRDRRPEVCVYWGTTALGWPEIARFRPICKNSCSCGSKWSVVGGRGPGPFRRVRAHPGRERAFDSSLSAPALFRRRHCGNQRGGSVSLRLSAGGVGGVQGEHKGQRGSLIEG